MCWRLFRTQVARRSAIFGRYWLRALAFYVVPMLTLVSAAGCCGAGRSRRRRHPARMPQMMRSVMALSTARVRSRVPSFSSISLT